MTLASQEFLLAKTEIQEKATRSKQAAVWLTGGGLLAFAGLVALVIGIAFGYGTFLPLWLAALLVGLLVMIAGAMMIQLGRNRFRRMGVAPEKTPASTSS
jgi:peptidoglycan/LPS O-acetylase OafA/YrhL